MSRLHCTDETVAAFPELEDYVCAAHPLCAPAGPLWGVPRFRLSMTVRSRSLALSPVRLDKHKTLLRRSLSGSAAFPVPKSGLLALEKKARTRASGAAGASMSRISCFVRAKPATAKARSRRRPRTSRPRGKPTRRASKLGRRPGAYGVAVL